MAETNYNPITKLRDLNVSIENIDSPQPSPSNPSVSIDDSKSKYDAEILAGLQKLQELLNPKKGGYYYDNISQKGVKYVLVLINVNLQIIKVN